MIIVLAPNAFKGSLTATQAVESMATGVLRVLPKAILRRVPVADGGDGLLDVLCAACRGKLHEVDVAGPLGSRVRAAFAILPEQDTAVMEMARASGLALLRPVERNPMRTSTAGTGELMLAAMDRGVRQIIIGIGGSATNDGGTGMAAALGWRFLDESGAIVKPVGGMLGRVRRIDASKVDPRLKKIKVEVVCDVTNPLLGPSGAAAVYAPQKGATPEDVRALDAGLANLAAVIRRDLGRTVENQPGSGAAGGLGAGLLAFADAILRPGAEIVLDLIGFNEALSNADLVFTAEGRLDEQTASGKAPAAVARRALARDIPCIALAGSVDPSLNLHDTGICAAFQIWHGALSLEEAMAGAAPLLAAATEQAFRVFVAGRQRDAGCGK